MRRSTVLIASILILYGFAAIFLYDLKTVPAREPSKPTVTEETREPDGEPTDADPLPEESVPEEPAETSDPDDGA